MSQAEAKPKRNWSMKNPNQNRLTTFLLGIEIARLAQEFRGGWFSCEDIFKRRKKPISKRTVYRYLNALVMAGILEDDRATSELESDRATSKFGNENLFRWVGWPT